MDQAASPQHPRCPVCELHHAPLHGGIHARAEARRLVALTVDPDADARPPWLRRASAKDITSTRK